MCMCVCVCVCAVRLRFASRLPGRPCSDAAIWHGEAEAEAARPAGSYGQTGEIVIARITRCGVAWRMLWGSSPGCMPSWTTAEMILTINRREKFSLGQP